MRGYRRVETGNADGRMSHPRRPKPKATHQSPTAMFAELKWQAGLRTHEHMIIMQANRLPTSRTQWLLDSPLLVYRCGGSAGFGLK
jgi:hypothetical protein